MAQPQQELVFAPLGGVGEIGMNLSIYGLGDGRTRSWLAIDLGVSFAAEELFAALSDSWTEYRGIWDDGRGFAEIRLKWLERAAGLGQPVSIVSGGSTIAGTFDTIDEAGCMIVRTADGRRMPITAGEVFFGTAASVGAA